MENIHLKKLLELVQRMIFALKTIPPASSIVKNPYLSRIMDLLNDLYDNTVKALTETDSGRLKGYLTAIYKAGTMLDDTVTLLERTVIGHQELVDSIKAGYDQIKRILADMEEDIVDRYGQYDALFIITPKFQSLTDMWWKYLTGDKEEVK